MANRVPQGKGSKDRTQDRKTYDANFDGIRWPSRGKPAPVDGKQGDCSASRAQAKHQTDAEDR